MTSERRMRANIAILFGLLAALLPWLPSCPARISAADLPPPLSRGLNSSEDSSHSTLNSSGGASTNSVQHPAKAEARTVAGNPPTESNCTSENCGNDLRNISLPETRDSSPEGAPEAPLPVDGASERGPGEEGNGLEAPGFADDNSVPKDSDLPWTNDTLSTREVSSASSSEVPSLEPPLSSARGRSIGGNEANHVLLGDTEDSIESSDTRISAKEEERGKGGEKDMHEVGEESSLEEEDEEEGMEGRRTTSEDDLSYHYKEFSKVEFTERDESTVAYATEKNTHVHFSSSKVVSEVYDSDDAMLTPSITSPSGPDEEPEEEDEETMEGEVGERSDVESMFTAFPTIGITPTKIPTTETPESENHTTTLPQVVPLNVSVSTHVRGDTSTSESRDSSCTSEECRSTNAIPETISFVTTAPSTTERTPSFSSTTEQEQLTTKSSPNPELSTSKTIPRLVTSTSKSITSVMTSIAKSTRRLPVSTTESSIKNEVTYNDNITALTYDLKANISLTTPVSVKYTSSPPSTTLQHVMSINQTVSPVASTASFEKVSETSSTTEQLTGFELPATTPMPEQHLTVRSTTNIDTSSTSKAADVTTTTTSGEMERQDTTILIEVAKSDQVTFPVTESELTTFPSTFHQVHVTDHLIESMSSTMDNSTKSISSVDNVTVEMTTVSQQDYSKVNDSENTVSTTDIPKSGISSDVSKNVTMSETTTVLPDVGISVSSMASSMPVEEETKIPLVTLTNSEEVSGSDGVTDAKDNQTVSVQLPETSTARNATSTEELTTSTSVTTSAFVTTSSSVIPTIATIALNHTSSLPPVQTQEPAEQGEFSKAYHPDEHGKVNETDVFIRAYPAFVRLWMKISWNEICREELQASLKEALSKLLSKSANRSIPTSRVVLLNFDESCPSSTQGTTKSLSPVYFCILAVAEKDQNEEKYEDVKEEGKFIVHCDSILTELFSHIWMQSPQPLIEPLKHIKEVDLVRSKWGAEDGMDFPPNPPDDNTSVFAAIGISCVAAVCLMLIGALLIIMRRRQTRFNYGQRCTPVSLDAYSLDSVSVRDGSRPGRGQVRNGEVSRGANGLRKGDGPNDWRASKRSYGNPAFEDDDGEEVLLSKPLNFAALTNAALNEEGSLGDEFGLIPKKFYKSMLRRKSRVRNREASAAERGEAGASNDNNDDEGLPEGAEEKNRYANVIPTPSTRVKLSAKPSGPLSTYINANYVRGHKNEEKFYIACQAPLNSTIEDFWRMIWEQQSKVIIMLTSLVENGVEKCADYLPPSEVLDCHRLFGDYQVTLKKRDVREKYIVSSLQLKDMESNLWREVTHLWFLGWPPTGVPEEPNQIVAFLIEARSYIQANTGPTVVHCSPGTGRTGTVIAIDVCIRDFEQNRMVDVPKVVQQLRRDREGTVQTQQQYAFIYQALSLYATKLTGGAMDSF